MEILNDAAAKPFVDGSAFHLYAGDISALSTVHNAFPDKNLYFTEQWTGANESFDGNLKWHRKKCNHRYNEELGQGSIGMEFSQRW